MHQSGHSRAQSMHIVQFSSFRAITPRERGGRGAISSGYCTVTALETMWRMVIPRPLSRPVPNVAFLSFDSSFTQSPLPRRPSRRRIIQVQWASFSAPVTKMLASDSGISTFQANFWS